MVLVGSFTNATNMVRSIIAMSRKILTKNFEFTILLQFVDLTCFGYFFNLCHF